MTTSQTANKSLYIITPGTETNTWGPYINDTTNYLDACLGTVTTISITGVSSYTLGVTEYQSTTIRVTGVLNSGNVTVKLPAGVSGQFTFINATTQTDATSTLLIGWSAGGNTISIPQNNTQILTGNGATPLWYQSAPAFSGTSTAITSISLTGKSTYTLTSTDILSQVIIFTGTLANSTVTIKLPDAYSGQWTIVNSTTAAGSSSLLQLTWVTSTTTYNVNQASSQIMYANNSGTPTWFSSAPQSSTGITTITLGSGDITITDAQARNPYFYITGTCPNYLISLYFPASVNGLYVFNAAYSLAGGSSQVAVLWSSGGSGQILTQGVKTLYLGSRSPTNSATGTWTALSL
jgi:hypothetical protein